MSERFPVWVSGYPDEWSVRPGGNVTFHVSGAGSPSVEAQLVQLIHGDEAPEGPGFKELEIAQYPPETYPLIEQETHQGSYGRIPRASHLQFDPADPISLFAFVRPSHAQTTQVVMSIWDQAYSDGFALMLEGLRPSVHLGEGRATTKVVADFELLPHTWYALCGIWDPSDLTLTVRAMPAVNSYSSRYGPTCEANPVSAHASVEAPKSWPTTDLLLAALDASDGRMIRGQFSGRIAVPAVFKRALSEQDMASLAKSGSRPNLVEDLVAWWDLSVGIEGFGLKGATPESPDGKLVNAPTRAVRGHNWDGSCHDWRFAPSLYGAVHFHDDDVDDAGWCPTLSVHLREDLASGVYALRLRAGNFEDHVPIFVGPNPRQRHDVAIVMPTASYMAYANEDAHGSPGEALIGVPTMHPLNILLLEHPEFGVSMYDLHSDGSGVSLSSRRRPIVGLRPRHRFRMPGTWQFASDLYLIDWMHQRGEGFDVLTDEDLHQEGVSALAPYKVVLTGTHPEYTSESMLNAYEDYVLAGGNVMYMGGNGFYWVISYHAEHPWLMEMRRGENGVRAWKAEPGETSHSTTGERGGLWRLRGRAPQKLFGTGFSSEGYGGSYPYVRLPDSEHPAAAWVFEGIAADEVIGDFGLIEGGASGQEIDRADVSLGTPPQTHLLATAFNLSDTYKIAPEDIGWIGDGPGGIDHPNVRADLTLYDAKGGGSVFATSSIAWAGALSHNDYDNSVAKITGNVLDRFKRKSST